MEGALGTTMVLPLLSRTKRERERERESFYIFNIILKSFYGFKFFFWWEVLLIFIDI